MTTLYKSKYKSGWIQDYTFLIVTSPRPPKNRIVSLL